MGSPRIAAALLAIALLPVWIVSAAPPTTPSGPPIEFTATGLTTPPWLSSGDAPVPVMVQLNTGRSTQSVSPDQVSAALAALGATEMFRTATVYRAIAVMVRPSQLAQIRKIPGVSAAQLITPKERLAAPASPTQAARAALRFPGATGRNTRIAVIDSGIDYTHADFGGPGTAAAYADPARIFPTAKVIGGYDFAGDGYDASGSGSSLIPLPDADPLDCIGHGTQVAGLAAGQGVTSSGQPYVGPYSGDLSGLAIPPGVAPEAKLYAFKVFGCSGTTALVSLAIDQAVALRPDVIVLALGTAFGSPNDPDSIAVQRAVAAGITVVAAAGDGGDSFYAVSSPASDPAAIAVGATDSSGVLGVLAGSARGPARDGTLKPDLVAPGAALITPAWRTGGGSSAFSGTSAATPQVGGLVALLRELHPGWTPQQIRAALVNTAVPVAAVTAGPAAPPSLIGAGAVGGNALRSPTLLVYPASGGGLAFGAPRAASAWQSSRTLLIENLSAAAQQVTISSSPTITLTDVTVSTPGGLLTIPARGTVAVSITAAFDPARLTIAPAAGTAPSQDGLGRYALSERGGLITVASQSSRLRIGHAAALGSALDVQLDDDPTLLGAPLNGTSSYTPLTNGGHRVQVWANPADRSAIPLLDTTITIPALGDYTLTFAGDEAGLQALLSGPEPTAPAGQVTVELLNAAPFGPLDVYSNTLDRIASGLAFGETRSITFPAGGRVIGYFRAGQPPSRASLVAWIVFDAAAGERLLVGAGDTANGSGYDAVCKAALDDLATKSPEFKQLFEARAGDTDFFNTVCTAGRRIVFDQRSGSLAGEQASVPYQIFPSPAAAATATASSVIVPSGVLTADLSVSNSGARQTATGQPASARSALVGALELQATSPALSAASGPAAADLHYVGMSSSYAVTGDPSASQFYIGAATYAPWATPNEVQILTYFDTTGSGGMPDGRDDFVALSTSYGAVRPSGAQQPNDVFINLVYRLSATGAISGAVSYTLWDTIPATDGAAGLDSAPFGTSSVIQSVSGQVLGLSAGHSRFNYHVETRARDADGFQRVVDRVPALGQPDLSYDPTRAALTPLSSGSLSQRPLFLDGAEPITIAIDQTALVSAVLGKQLLLLHLHNQTGTQAELVTFRSTQNTASVESVACCYRAVLPSIHR